MDISTLIKNYLHKDIRDVITKSLEFINEKDFQEIRIRLNMPLEIKVNGKKHLLLENGTTTDDFKRAFVVNKEAFLHTLSKISAHSMYAFSDELKNGFITLKGSHRVGIVGTCVIENGVIKSVKDISSLNIRLSHEIIDVSKKITKIYQNDIENTLIISPPGGGKTTLLRDLIRVFSDEFNKTVGVVDERSEICDSHYVGVRTDVITNCPKSVGMTTLLRTMSPDIICVDEIGKKEDVLAIEELFNCGVKVLATIHGKSIFEVKNKENIKTFLEKKSFKFYIILGKNPKERPKIFDENFEEVLCLD